VLDAEGRSDFQALQNLMRKGKSATPVFYAFDLPYCDNHDLRNTPLVERKELLASILKQSANALKYLRYSEHHVGTGDSVIEAACRMKLEGIISKKADAAYVSTRSGTWLKSKCGGRQEFVIVGYTDPKGSRTGLGALLLGYHDPQGKLVYAGRVGTGFNEKMLKDLTKQFAKHAIRQSPVEHVPARERREAHWIEPKFVGEVKFTGWTDDNILRHPSFVALRSDKPAREIVREDLQPMGRSNGQHASNGSVKKSHAKKAASPRDNEYGLSSPDKILYPEAKLTKLDLAKYYDAVADLMLPHVANRPLAVLRCPEGRGKTCFFQRHANKTVPDAVDSIDVSEKEGEPKQPYLMIRDKAGLIALVQIGALEIHMWGSTADDIEHAERLVFDLDPDPDLPFRAVAEAAEDLRKVLAGLKLPAFLKTTGGKGLHVVVPLKQTVDWDGIKDFSRVIAEDMARRKPELYLVNMRKALRKGKIYIDFLRNARAATAVAPYSFRAREGAPVSAPLAWSELKKLKSASQFTVSTMLGRIKRQKRDPWAAFEKSRVDLLKVLKE
jgi:bifunctional non-homologous end joining protein LigD